MNKHKILILGGDSSFNKYQNIHVEPIYVYKNKKDKFFFKIREHLPYINEMSRWYGPWKKSIMNYDTIFISDGIRGRDVIKFIRKSNPKVRIIIFYINTYEYGARNDPEHYKDLGVELYTYDKEQARVANIPFKHFYYEGENEYKKFISAENTDKRIYQDIFFVGEDKDRMAQLMKLHKLFKKLRLKDKLIIVASKHKKYTQKQKDMLSDRISYYEVMNNIWHSRAILDLSWSRQHGITLRPMEAMFFRKKLITNNTDIINYDFYKKNNVFILGKDDPDNLLDFLSGEYQPVSDEVLKRYTQDWWINSFFED